MQNSVPLEPRRWGVAGPSQMGGVTADSGCKVVPESRTSRAAGAGQDKADHIVLSGVADSKCGFNGDSFGFGQALFSFLDLGP